MAYIFLEFSHSYVSPVSFIGEKQDYNCVVIIYNFSSQNCNSCFVVFYYSLLRSKFFRPEDLCIFMCLFLLEAGCLKEFSLHYNVLPGWDEFCLTWSKAFIQPLCSWVQTACSLWTSGFPTPSLFCSPLLSSISPLPFLPFYFCKVRMIIFYQIVVRIKLRHCMLRA